jgi:hypothetical protein
MKETNIDITSPMNFGPEDTIKPGGKMYIREYKNLGEVLGVIENSKSDCPKSVRASIQGDNDFTQTESLEHAIKLARRGWPTGLGTIHKLYKQYEKIFADYFPEQDYSQEVKHVVTGEVVDMDKYLIGDPEHMMRYEENTLATRAGTKLQRVIFQSAYNCNILPQTVFIRGALAVALVGALESSGFRTELIARFVISDGNYNSQNLIVVDIPIKAFDESPDFDRVAFIFAHPSMLRRLCFGIYEEEKQNIRTMFGIANGGGYGRAVNYKGRTTELNDLYFPLVTANDDLNKMVKDFCDVIKSRFGEEFLSE